MATILDGKATDAQIAAFAVALRAKGETPAELAALVRTMLAYADQVEVQPEAEAGPLVDTCGTGGDRSHTFNISTTAALVVAGAGVRVAKHGNRAASSQCGSADVLESARRRDRPRRGGRGPLHRRGRDRVLLRPEVPPRVALRRARPRSQIGVPTTFNFLGPLANPARVQRQMVGVGDPAMADADRRRARRARLDPGHGVLRPRRSRRADHRRFVDGAHGGVRQGAVTSRSLDPTAARARTGRGSTISGAATPPTTPRSSGPCSRASPARPRRRAAQRRRPRSRWRARPTRGRQGSSGRSGDRRRPRERRARPVDRRLAGCTGGGRLMGVALQCPECGFKHRLDAIGDRAVFSCARCSRELKVPAEYRAAAAPVTNGTGASPAVKGAARARSSPPPHPKHRVGAAPMRLPVRILLWVVALVLGALVVRFLAKATGFAGGNTFFDLLIDGSVGTYLRLFALVPVWALFSTLFATAFIDGPRRGPATRPAPPPHRRDRPPPRDDPRRRRVGHRRRPAPESPPARRPPGPRGQRERSIPVGSRHPSRPPARVHPARRPGCPIRRRSRRP